MAGSRRRPGPAALLLSLAVAWPLAAQASETPEVFKAEWVRTGLYLISGGGGNSLLRFTGNGSVLINGKQPGSYSPLMTEVRRISRLGDMPLRALVLTNHLETHAGNSAEFAAAKVAIVAQSLTMAQLPAALPPQALLRYERDFTLTLGGVEIRLLHFGPARTGGDAVAFFQDMKVLAIGDLFTPGEPVPEAGGSLRGWSAVLAEILALDFEQAVPSAGPPVSRAEVAAFKARIDALLAALRVSRT